MQPILNTGLNFATCEQSIRIRKIALLYVANIVGNVSAFAQIHLVTCVISERYDSNPDVILIYDELLYNPGSEVPDAGEAV